jgi:hypothetical protein
MGVETKVTFGERGCPAWARVNDLLTRRGFPVVVRMLDGELRLPDEEVPTAWQELRVGTPQGMVTLKRQGNGLAVVVWGNADETLRQAQATVAAAWAEASGGSVQAGE